MKWVDLFMIVLAVVFVIAIASSFRAMRANAIKKGHGPAAANVRGVAYVVVAIGYIVFFFFVLANTETIGLGWALLLNLLVLVGGGIFFGVWWDKKPNSNKENRNNVSE